MRKLPFRNPCNLSKDGGREPTALNEGLLRPPHVTQRQSTTCRWHPTDGGACGRWGEGLRTCHWSLIAQREGSGCTPHLPSGARPPRETFLCTPAAPLAEPPDPPSACRSMRPEQPLLLPGQNEVHRREAWPGLPSRHGPRCGAVLVQKRTERRSTVWGLTGSHWGRNTAINDGGWGWNSGWRSGDSMG